MNRPMGLNGYLYVEGNAINLADASGLCPHLLEPGIGNRINAKVCHDLVDKLDEWNIKVVWDESSIPPLSCIPETVQNAATQAQGVKQRWTTNEVRAIYNAFRIFNKAHETFSYFADVASDYGVSFPYDYAWPLALPITIEKRRYAGWANVDLSGYDEDPASSANPIGIHYYSGGNAETTRRIIMSGPRWGEANTRMTRQARSWLVLHEFAHIFSRDRLTSRCGRYDSAERQLILEATLPVDGGLDFDASGSPTQYSTYGEAGSARPESFGQEYYTEAITGLIWNYGWNAVPGYTRDAGGWYRENVVDIVGANGTRLSTWVLYNVIGLTSCPV